MRNVGVSDEEGAIIETVAAFIERTVRPRVHELEAHDRYPGELIDEMKRLGVFGLCVPPPFGDVQVSTRCFALVTEELARGWMSLAGAVGGHSVVCHIIATFGTEDQKRRYLPRLATGEVRAAMALTEPGGGSDLQGMRTTASETPNGWRVNGSKTWITNGRRADLVALLCKTDPAADPVHRGISVLLAERGEGFSVARDLPKLGYKGIESSELVFDNFFLPYDAVLGGKPGKGFSHMMRGLELGRVQVAARAVGVARAAFEEAIAYSQERETFGKPIWQHQSIANHLADMATKLEAARLLTLSAADHLDAGIRSDLEAGMAKLYASEACMEITLTAMRVFGGNGYSQELNLERYYRDAPLMILGEGTNEIQRQVIARQLIARYPQ